MKEYIVYDKANGNIDYMVRWDDNREFPIDTLLASQDFILLDEGNPEDINGFEYCYNVATKEFHRKLTMVADVFVLNHIDGIANITIRYPYPINEECTFKVDQQTVTLDVVNGEVTFPFASQIIGFHNIEAISSSFYGKASYCIEVI